MVIKKLTQSQKLDINLIKSVDRENEVKVRFHVPGRHVHIMINMWTKYGELKLYGNEETDLITKT